jgi:S-DNA-T family DNA segregation ATPase FtsK/SpoIIIE
MLDEQSRRALTQAHQPGAPGQNPGQGCGEDNRPALPAPPPAPQDAARDTESAAEQALWRALCLAPHEGADVAELMRASGMSRPTLYRHVAEHARAGRAVQVSRGRWRAQTPPEANHE